MNLEGATRDSTSWPSSLGQAALAKQSWPRSGKTQNGPIRMECANRPLNLDGEEETERKILGNGRFDG